MKLLRQVKKIALDANILLYYLHDDSRFGEKVAKLFELIKRKQKALSALILTEIFVYTFEQDRQDLQKEQLEMISKTSKLELVSADQGICLLAAQLRAAYRLRTPDAIHLATAIQSDCDVFITNDENLKKIKEIKVFTLKDL